MKEIVKKYISPYYPRMSMGFVIKFIGTIMDLCIPYILAHTGHWEKHRARRGMLPKIWTYKW